MAHLHIILLSLPQPVCACTTSYKGFICHRKARSTVVGIAGSCKYVNEPDCGFTTFENKAKRSFFYWAHTIVTHNILSIFFNCWYLYYSRGFVHVCKICTPLCSLISISHFHSLLYKRKSNAECMQLDPCRSYTASWILIYMHIHSNGYWYI